MFTRMTGKNENAKFTVARQQQIFSATWYERDRQIEFAALEAVDLVYHAAAEDERRQLRYDTIHEAI